MGLRDSFRKRLETAKMEWIGRHPEEVSAKFNFSATSDWQFPKKLWENFAKFWLPNSFPPLHQCEKTGIGKNVYENFFSLQDYEKIQEEIKKACGGIEDENAAAAETKNSDETNDSGVTSSDSPEKPAEAVPEAAPETAVKKEAQEWFEPAGWFSCGLLIGVKHFDVFFYLSRVSLLGYVDEFFLPFSIW